MMISKVIGSAMTGNNLDPNDRAEVNSQLYYSLVTGK